jgi:hypothetical protein
LALLVDTNFVVGKVTMSLWYTESLAVPMKLEKVYLGMVAPYYVFGSKPLKLNATTTTTGTAAAALGVQVTGRLLAKGRYTLTIVAADSPTTDL